MKAVSLIEFVLSTDWKTQGKLLDHIGLPEVPNKTNNRIYADFLNQAFKPEMIIEKFNGWEQKPKLYFEDIKNLHSISMYYKNQFNIYSNTLKYTINFPIPKTLEDFVKFCSYAEIELEFKFDSIHSIEHFNWLKIMKDI